jgi:hypothetical protein
MLTIGIGLLAYLLLGALAAAVSGSFSIGGWAHQLFIVLDQLLNVLLTPFNRSAWADETMSARAYRADRDGRRWGRLTRPVIDWIFTLQRAPGGHCKQAYERELARKHLPPELRP